MNHGISTKGLLQNDVEYRSDGVGISAFMARPDKPKEKLPAIIVVHEIFGLNDHIKDVAKRFAEEGYVVIAPDLYSRPGLPITKEGISKTMGIMMSIPPAQQRDPNAMKSRISKLPVSEREEISRTMDWLRNRDYRQNVLDLSAALSYLRGQRFVDAHRIASLGFCMGGTLSARLASSGADLAACVIFYGEAPPVGEIPEIKCPVLGIYGGEDHRITDAVPALSKEMADKNKEFDYKIFEGAHHAFFNDTSHNYNKRAAEEAWNILLEFLHSKL